MARFSAYLVGTAFTALALTSQPSRAQAQDQVPAEAQKSGTDADIVVTAQKIETKVQDTPIAISVVPGETIQKEGRSKLDDVLVNEPGVVVQGVARGQVASIRGLGLNLPPQNGAGAVANNYDGVYSSRAESASAGFYDIQRVEVLRGPQSTLYGRNAVGGVVNVISRNPSFTEFGGYVQGEVGNYSNLRGEGALNLPLSEQWALRVAGAVVSRDGYISNGRDDSKAWSGRAKLLFQPADGYSMLLGYEHTHLGGKGPGAVPTASYLAGTRVASDPPDGYQDGDTNKVWLEVHAEAGPGEVVLIPSYQWQKGLVQGAFGGNFANNYDPLYTDQMQLEARYSSLPGAPVQWNIGYYKYYNQGATLGISGSCVLPNGTVLIPEPGFSNAGNGPPGACQVRTYQTEYSPDRRTIDSDAVFGQVVIPVGIAKITAGGRHTWETAAGQTDLNSGNTAGADDPFTGLPGTPVTTPDFRYLTPIKSSYFDWKLGVDVDLGPTLLYATAGSGHRQAGYGFAGPGATPGSYQTEKMVGYEVGLKNTFLGGSLLFNVDGFYYDYDRYQLVVVRFDLLPPIINIFTPPAREFGAEAQLVWAPSDADRIDASLVYLDSKVTNDGTVEGQTFGGQRFPNTPEWQFKFGYGHEFDLGNAGKLRPSFDFRALSSQIVFPVQNDDGPAAVTDKTTPGYVTGDAFLRWTSANDAISVTAYVKNVNDKLIKQSSFFGYVQLQAPRTYGLIASVAF